MKTLQLHDLDSSDRLVWPDDFTEIDLHSPALNVVTDFHAHEPLVINGDMRADEAERLIRQSHEGLKLVLDSHGAFIGTISRDALFEANRLKLVAAGDSLEDIRVRDLMRPRHRIRAVDVGALEQATVRDVLEALRFDGQQHCLVVDPEAHHICGLIAASDIARRLRVAIDVEGPPTFAELHQAVLH